MFLWRKTAAFCPAIANHSPLFPMGNYHLHAGWKVTCAPFLAFWQKRHARNTNCLQSMHLPQPNIESPRWINVGWLPPFFFRLVPWAGIDSNFFCNDVPRSKSSHLYSLPSSSARTSFREKNHENKIKNTASLRLTLRRFLVGFASFPLFFF